MTTPTSRRSFLTTATAGAAASLAGCIDSLTGNDSDRINQLESKVEALKAENARLRSQLENSSTSGAFASGNTTSTTTSERVTDLQARISELEAANERLRKQLNQSSTAGEPTEFDAQTRQRAQQAGKEARRTVVYIRINHGGGHGESGTGWFYDENHVVTNAHVVDTDAQGFDIWTLDQQELSAELVNKTDRYEDPIDLALLRLTGDGTAPHSLSRGSADNLSKDQPVIQVGHPLFIGHWMISLGTYLRTDSSGDLTTKMPHASGNSGSPLLTLDGNVVGLTWGSTPAGEQSGPNETPDPDNATVYEEYPYQERIRAKHDPIGPIEDKISEWI